MQTEALFEQIADRLSLELSQATDSIYIAVAWFTNVRLFDILVDKARQGVSVSLMVSNDFINRKSKIDYHRLNIAGSKVMIGNGDQDLMHNKFCVIDCYTVITGSYNWSYKAEKNHENITITKGDTLLARQFVDQFNKLLNRYQHTGDSEPLPIGKVIKRLEILKNYIALEDDDDIAKETAKLTAYQNNVHQSNAHQSNVHQSTADQGSERISQITQALQQYQFAHAVELIDAFIKSYSQVAVFNDVDVMALKLEIRCLEHQLNAFDNEKIELEKLLTEFNHRHTLELGDHIRKLLSLKKQLFKDDPIKFAEAEQDEKDYEEQVKVEEQKTIFELTPDEKAMLKKQYRKASQLCHPDRVSDDMKQMAQQVFIELNQAYEKNDIRAVNQILEQAQQGIFKPRSETIGESEQLKAIIATLKMKIAQTEQAIFAIKDSETYQTVNQIDDWDVYFADTKAQLIDQINQLKAQLAQMN